METKDEILLCIDRGFTFIYNKIDKNRRAFKVNGFERIDKSITELIPFTQPVGEFRNLTTVYRSKAEFNTSYIQIVVAAIIRCNDKIILLEKQNGDLNHRTTLPQGHVSIDSEELNECWNFMRLKDVLEFELKREINEEIIFKFPKELELNNPILRFNTMNFDNPKDISYYHYGYIFEYILPIEYEKWFCNDYILSGEPNKNKIKIFNLHNRLDDNNDYPPDSWLKEILQDYYIGKRELELR